MKDVESVAPWPPFFNLMFVSWKSALWKVNDDSIVALKLYEGCRVVAGDVDGWGCDRRVTAKVSGVNRRIAPVIQHDDSMYRLF